MKILAIETSCDETAISIVGILGKEVKILSHAVLSQIDIHKEWGGVVPSLAKREHQKNLFPILIDSLKEAGLFESAETKIDEEKIKQILVKEPELLPFALSKLKNIKIPDIDKIAVTSGPGLEPALWVGISFAKVLALTWSKPIIPANHMEGHIYSSILQKRDLGYEISDIKFPAVALLISGGHTELVLMKSFGSYELIGKTRDDAVGEAFDKVARILGLPYPGGPEISRLAEKFDPRGWTSQFSLPRPMINSNDFDFSFSGLKTAVLYDTKKIGDLSETQKINLAHEFEMAVTEVVVKKTIKAIDQFGAKSLIVGGGVIANKRIRAALSRLAAENSFDLYLPESQMTTDNATMIAIAANFGQEGDPNLIKANGTLTIH